MKPVLLRMQAFGAYASEQIIDFTRLGDKNFFLITGPTGSGKTTILDALTFALYGTASGRLRDGKSLRSDYAPVETRTLVEFTFTLGERKYCVSRSPEQEVAKQRGSGTRKLPAAASLVQLLTDGSLKPLAAKVDEVTRTVTSLLGFNADQFTQIVLLPQGEFRQFLLAESQDRKSILETIFNTVFYSRLENLLAEKAKALAADYETKKQQRAFWLEQQQITKEEELPAKLTALTAKLTVALTQKAQGQAKLDDANTKLTAAEILEGRFRENEAAAAALQTLTATLPELEKLQQQIKTAEAALTLKDSYRAAYDAYQQLKQNTSELETVAASLQKAKLEVEKFKQQIAGSLATFLPDVSARSSAPAAGTLSPAAATHTAPGETELFSLFAGSASQNPAGSSPQEALQSLEATISHLTTEAGKLAGVTEELERLAASLEDGVPCPVCGSLHHPHPATVTAEARAALQNDINLKTRAASRLKALQQHLFQAQTRETAVQSQSEALQKQQDKFKLKAQETQRLYQQELTASVFADTKSFLQAAKLSVSLAKLRQEVKHREAVYAAARDRANRAAAAIKDQVRPALAALRQQAQELARLQEAAVKEASILEAQQQSLTQAQKALAALQTQLAALDEAYQTSALLAETAKGNNAARISLSAFVLQTILDDVLLAANVRLETMSSGRYLLRRSEVLGDARKKSGLNLEVSDAYTGVARPVKTLSGGEIFLASLALALGLTDVVQSYAGGLRLDTILVDEGFGSLDPEALDAALAALTDLQANGRLVGIISHVAELEERIPTRLEIIPGEHGSRAEWII
jgi:exonuclease SbcC